MGEHIPRVYPLSSYGSQYIMGDNIGNNEKRKKRRWYRFHMRQTLLYFKTNLPSLQNDNLFRKLYRIIINFVKWTFTCEFIFCEFIL